MRNDSGVVSRQHAQERTNVHAHRIQRFLAPSAVDATFVFWAAVIAFAFNHRVLNTDGDPAWQLRLGRAMLEQRQVLRVHTFSHTAFGRPFPPMEWAGQVLLALSERAGGLAGVIVFTALVLAATYALLLRYLQRRGVDVLLGFALVSMAALLTSPYWAARPHIFTYLATVLLLPLLWTCDWRRVWLFAPLFLSWANLHGGFLFGLGLVAVQIAATGVGWLWRRTAESGRRLRYYVGGFALGVAASCVNPSGPRLWAAELIHLTEPSVRLWTEEFASPDFHTAGGLLFLAVLLPVIAALCTGRVKLSPSAAATFLAATALALLARRNVPLFGLAGLPALAPAMDPAWRDIGSRTLGRLRRTFTVGDDRAARGPWAGGFAVLLLLVAASRGRLFDVPLVPNRFDPGFFPVAAVDRARAAGLDGRMFNDLQWGGYVLWAWPEQKVFIDGATSFYGTALAETYLNVINLGPGWRDALDRRGITLVLVRPASRLARALASEPGWETWYSDATAIVLLRRGAAEPSARRG